MGLPDVGAYRCLWYFPADGPTIRRVPHLTLLQGGQGNNLTPGFAPFDEERVRAEFLEDWYAVHDRDPGESVINLWVETRQIEYEAAVMGAPIGGESSPPKLSVVY